MSERSKQTNKKSTFPLKSALLRTPYVTHIRVTCAQRTLKNKTYFGPFYTNVCTHTHPPSFHSCPTPTPSTTLPAHLLRLEKQQNQTCLWLVLLCVTMSTSQHKNTTPSVCFFIKDDLGSQQGHGGKSQTPHSSLPSFEDAAKTVSHIF